MHDAESDPAHLDSLFRRQEARLSLADAYWDLAGGRPGFRVADVGCGPGAFTLRYASLTGPTGHVHAVDADAEALAFLAARLDPVHHAHVTTELLDVSRAPLPPLAFDVVFVTDALHHVHDLDTALRNLRESRARLVIAEFDPAAPADIGPPLAMRLSPAIVLRSLEAAGWRPGSVVALEHEHYAIVSLPAS